MDEFADEIRAQQEASKQTLESVNLQSLIESRITEIISIENECKTKLPKQMFQRLPRFMRRRAACSDIGRVPKKYRSHVTKNFGSKTRAKLMRHRRKTQYKKNKRILKRHSRRKVKDPTKSLLHKWFAKRFKMRTDPTCSHMPLHNNTKNQRNLYRQTRSGCCFLSMLHLRPIQIQLCSPKDVLNYDQQLSQLNSMTESAAGFTFKAKALEQGNYEVCIHLYKRAIAEMNASQEIANGHDDAPTLQAEGTSPDAREYLCPAIATLRCARTTDAQCKKNPVVTLWIPRNRYAEVFDQLDKVRELSKSNMFVKRMWPQDYARIRLVGPKAREHALKLVADQQVKQAHLQAIKEVDLRLSRCPNLTIGRHMRGKWLSVTYYSTKPQVVDIMLKGSEGRKLWNGLIKNRAHLVGGYRDLNRLLTDKSQFELAPDCDTR